MQPFVSARRPRVQFVSRDNTDPPGRPASAPLTEQRSFGISRPGDPRSACLSPGRSSELHDVDARDARHAWCGTLPMPPSEQSSNDGELRFRRASATKCPLSTCIRNPSTRSVAAAGLRWPQLDRLCCREVVTKRTGLPEPGSRRLFEPTSSFALVGGFGLCRHETVGSAVVRRLAIAPPVRAPARTKVDSSTSTKRGERRRWT